MTIFDFFKIRFLGFYKSERKSEDIFVLRGGSGLSIDIHFADIELSYDVFSPLPVKTFQPPSSLHRDRYHDL